MRYYLKPGASGIWYIHWTDGRPRRRSTRTRDRELARAKLEDWRLKHAKPRHELPSDVPLAGVLVRYWIARGQHRFCKQPILHMLKAVPTHLPGITVAQFTPEKQELLVKALAVSPSSARRYMGVVQTALNYAHRRQEIAHVPRLMPIEGDEGEGARPFTEDELGAILAAARTPYQRLYALLAITTGPRPSAPLQLTWDRVGPSTIDYNVPNRRRTKKRRAIAPLAPTVARYLEAHRSVGPVVARHVKRTGGDPVNQPIRTYLSMVRRLLKRAGIEGSAYGMRKGLATYLRAANVPEWEVGALLAHRVASSTTERYAHERPDYMAATKSAIETLLRRIAPDWVAVATKSYPEPEAPKMRISMTVNGLAGGPCWARTSDQLLKSEVVIAQIQPLECANDD